MNQRKLVNLKRSKSFEDKPNAQKKELSEGIDKKINTLTQFERDRLNKKDRNKKGRNKRETFLLPYSK